MKIQLIDFGGRSPERAYANDAGADVFSTKDEVIRPGDICKLPLGFGLKIPILQSIPITIIKAVIDKTK